METVRNREFASAGCILPTNWGEGEGGLEGEQWLQQPRGPPYVRISWKSCGRRCRGSLEYLAFNLITQLPHPRREATLSSFVWNGGGHFLPFPRVSPAFSAANRDEPDDQLSFFLFFFVSSPVALVVALSLLFLLCLTREKRERLATLESVMISKLQECLGGEELLLEL